MCITQLFILYNDFHQKQKAEQLEYENEFISYKLLYNLLIDSPLDILLIVEKKSSFIDLHIISCVKGLKEEQIREKGIQQVIKLIQSYQMRDLASFSKVYRTLTDYRKIMAKTIWIRFRQPFFISFLSTYEFSFVEAWNRFRGVVPIAYLTELFGFDDESSCWEKLESIGYVHSENDSKAIDCSNSIKNIKKVRATKKGTEDQNTTTAFPNSFVIKRV